MLKLFAGRFFLLLAVCGLGACATTGAVPEDPWEGFNRKVFAVNDTLDEYALKPTAQAYRAAVPLPARTNASNFFGNIEDVWIGFNNLLQGKPKEGLTDWGRFALNSTIGILGFFDVASELGLEKHDEDFGQTLGSWGVESGPYLMLPLLGPSSVRDTGGMAVDRLAFSPSTHFESVPARNGLFALKIIDTRTQLLGADAALEDAALDKYNYLRGFYLKRRQSKVFDGNPPREKEDYR